MRTSHLTLYKTKALHLQQNCQWDIHIILDFSLFSAIFLSVKLFGGIMSIECLCKITSHDSPIYLLQDIFLWRYLHTAADFKTQIFLSHSCTWWAESIVDCQTITIGAHLSHKVICHVKLNSNAPNLTNNVRDINQGHRAMIQVIAILSIYEVISIQTEQLL